jgi:hypothetical protein
MYNVKILSAPNHIHKAEWIDGTKQFEFSTGTSAPPVKISLKKGDIIELDTEAIGKAEFPVGMELKVSGVFNNFYKTGLLTLCVTKHI